MKQSAVGWIIDQLFELRNPTLNQIQIFKKAREMEKQQQDEFAIEFAEWCCAKTLGTDNFKLNDGELKQFKKEKGYVHKNH